jgi:hypothetical protein
VVTPGRPGRQHCVCRRRRAGRVEPRPGGAVGYPELAGNRRCGCTTVEGPDQHLLVFAVRCLRASVTSCWSRTWFSAVSARPPVGGLGVHGDGANTGGAVGFGQQVARDPQQPWPDRLVMAGSLRQVRPGPDDDLLHDVIGARPVGAEPLNVVGQGDGVTRVQLADGGGLANRLPKRRLLNVMHIYYHG